MKVRQALQRLRARRNMALLDVYTATNGPACLLQSVKDMPVLQDGPPPGGFPSVRYARRLPSTGPTGFTMFAVGAAVMAYGFYKVVHIQLLLAPCSRKGCSGKELTDQ